MDEVFGAENFVSSIAFARRRRAPSSELPRRRQRLSCSGTRETRDAAEVSTALSRPRVDGRRSARATTLVELPDGTRRRMTSQMEMSESMLSCPRAARLFRLDNLTSAAARQTRIVRVRVRRTGRIDPGTGDAGRPTATACDGLPQADRLVAGRQTRCATCVNLDDFPVSADLTNVWDDTGIGGFAIRSSTSSRRTRRSSSAASS